MLSLPRAASGRSVAVVLPRQKTSRLTWLRGATKGPLRRPLTAFGSAFLGSAALWWLYFARHAETARDRVARHHDPARLGRGAYAYGVATRRDTVVPADKRPAFAGLL
jgi:hypothetical protein